MAELSKSPDALIDGLADSAPPLKAEPAGPTFSVVPSTSSFPTFRSSSSLTPLVCDERAIARLLETLISRSGMSIGLVADRMGVTTNAIRQYMRGRRTKPSLIWFIRLVEICGGSVKIEFPKGR